MTGRRLVMALCIGGALVVAALTVARLALRDPMPPLPPEPTLAGAVAPVVAQVREAYGRAAARPEDATRSGRVAMLLHAYDQPAVAVVWYERARRLAPRDHRWTYLLALVQSAAGRYDDARARLEELLKHQPDYIPGRVALGSVLLAAGRPEESRQIFADLLVREPVSRHAHYGLGRALAALGQGDRAIAHLERAAAGPPEFAAARYALSLAYRDAGRDEAARQQLALYRQNPGAQYARLDPLVAEVMALDIGPSSYRRRAITLFAEGKRAESAAELETLVRLDPTDDNAHSDLVDIYAALGQWEPAEAHYRAAVALRPTSRGAHLNWGSLLLRRQRFDEAAKAFARVLELDPADAFGHVRLGQALEGQGQLREAVTHYRRAVDLDPGNREARSLLGRRSLAEGRIREAIGHLERTLTPIDSRTPRFMRDLGLAYARAGDRERAARQLEEAERLARAAGQAILRDRIDADLSGLTADRPRGR